MGVTLRPTAPAAHLPPLRRRAPPRPPVDGAAAVVPSRASAAHRADIQGLRAVAVILVVLGHAGVGFLGGGFVGVDVFFVLSGFLITGLLLAEARAHGSVSLVEFYARRARRILPAAALTLLVTDVAAYFVLNFVRARGAVMDSVNAAAFSANFHFAAQGVDYFARSDPPSPLLHYWSLSVEEQFYLAWPLLLSVALFGVAFQRRRSPRRSHDRRLLHVVLILACASLAWSIYETTTLRTFAYFSPFTRAWELGFGAVLAVTASSLARIPVRTRAALGWLGLAAVAVAATVYSEQTPFPGSLALLPTGGCAAAIVAGMGARCSRFSVTRVLALRPLGFVGDRSYAFYLWHWPVLILAAEYSRRPLSVNEGLALMVGAFALSCASYTTFENPIRRKMKGRRSTAAVAALCFATVFATAGVSLAAIDREEQRFQQGSQAAVHIAPAATRRSRLIRADGVLPAVVAAVKASDRGAPIPRPLEPPIGRLRTLPSQYGLPTACIGHDSSSNVETRVCRLGRPSSTKLVVLLGDSHAMMWWPAVVDTARRERWAVVPLLRLGCTPGNWTTPGGPSTCRPWYRWALAQVARLHPAVTLVTGNLGSRDASNTGSATAGLLAAAEALKPSTKVVVIGDPEGLGRNPVDCLLSPHATMRTCTTTWPASAFAQYDRVARGSSDLGVSFLPTRGFVCYGQRCPAVVGHTIVWMDDNHMTFTYSAQVAPVFRHELLERMPAGFR